MQGGGQGRGASRQGYTGRGAAGRGGGGGAAPSPPVMYGGMPSALSYGGWGPYSNYHMPGYYPTPPVIRPPFARGAPARSFVPLGVQGAGILKRPAGPSHGQGRGYNRGRGGRNWGRNRKNITKEALDADLDEWRMKDKKFGGQSLDSDLDDYWKKKQEDGEDSKEDTDVEGKDDEPHAKKGIESPPDPDVPKKITVRTGASQTISQGSKVERSPTDNGNKAAR